MAKKIIKLGAYRTLVAQLDKLARHNRQGSFQTKTRYYEACKRFCAFLADKFHLQKLTNISGKHLTSYVLWMQENGKAASTIKTDLAAIRFFHDKMSNPKYRLPDNDELAVELERRCFGGTDRTWSIVEFNKMLGRAMALDRWDYILALYLARYAGLRIPKQALHMEKYTTTDEQTGETTEHQMLGVYVLMAGRAEFKQVKVVTESQDFYVVNAVDATAADTLRAGDEVIVRAVGLYDGKLMDA